MDRKVDGDGIRQGIEEEVDLEFTILVDMDECDDDGDLEAAIG